MWQDYLITAGCIVMGIALFPSVLSKNKPARSSCLITTVCLIIFAFAFGTLRLWIACVTEVFVAIMWGILLFQKRL